MTAPRRVTLIPLIGPFHTRFPLYNVVHVRALLEALEPQAVALATLPPGALDDAGWQATAEIALPHTVVPWALKRRLAVVEVGSTAGLPGEPGDPGDEDAFRRYLSEFEAGRQHLRSVQAALAPVEELLARSLDLSRIFSDLVPALSAYDDLRRDAFGEGPGTGWQATRAVRMADRTLAVTAEHVALLVGVDDLAPLRRALSERVLVDEPPHRLDLSEADSKAAKERTLLDVAMRAEVDDPAALLGQLRELGSPEARYHEANILLAHGHAAEALEVLKSVASGDFQKPYYLPGFVLARLGELHDLAGDRRAALRAYRGALALEYTPPEALESARAGLERPFEPQPSPDA